MTEPRPHREPLAPERAARDPGRGGERRTARRRRGRRRCSRRPGQRAPRIERPAGLTEREAEVVGLLARGLQTKQVARALGISVKTADRHIQNAYRKIGVSTRAAATLFAMEHGLVAWGELPIVAAGGALVASSRLGDPPSQAQAKEDAMATEAIERAARGDLRDRRGDRADAGSAAAPTSRRSRRRSANGCCASFAPRPGDTVLELAAGVGDTGFDAAAIVGERGRLISTDFSPAMLDAARRRGAERGLDNVEYRVIDAERIELDADSVDGVLCRFGYMLMADPAAALAETRRVLRPGGRAGARGLGRDRAQPVVRDRRRSAWSSAATCRRPSRRAAPGPFSMASAERTDGAAATAPGSPSVRTEEVPVRFVFADVGRVPRA